MRGGFEVLNHRPHYNVATRTVWTPENVQRVRTAENTSPGRSARRKALALRLGCESVRQILKLDLKFHPYQVVCVQE